MMREIIHELAPGDEDLTTLAARSSGQLLPHPLTARELEILRLMADGLNSRDVAQHLILSVGTIRWYLKLIYSKLDAHSRSEALAYARALNCWREVKTPLFYSRCPDSGRRLRPRLSLNLKRLSS